VAGPYSADVAEVQMMWLADDVAICDWLNVDESHGDTWHEFVQWEGATWPN
jgi:hypothetical protein